MEEEERSAQSAKLQELIRRGTPHDLQEANKLMKVMAGYDNRHKTDYRAKAAEEVGRIQQKAKILEEMLQEHTRGDESINDDGFEVCQFCIRYLASCSALTHTSLCLTGARRSARKCAAKDPAHVRGGVGRYRGRGEAF